MEIPDLSGIITKDDIEKKGGNGSFSADYIPWAKTQKILSESAPGWFFNIEPAPDGSFIWRTPKDSGVIMGYFQKDSFKTPLFPYAITYKNHQVKPYKEIDSRDFCDNHRRALCACACFTFNLAYELWAKIEIQDEEIVKPPNQQKKTTVSDELFAQILKYLKGPHRKQILEDLKVEDNEGVKQCDPENVKQVLDFVREIEGN